MSVNAGERNVPDSSTNRQLIALEKALDLSLHTIQLCKNKNIFKEEYQNALTNDIIRCGKDIYISAWHANNIRVGDDPYLMAERDNYQRMAIDRCTELIGLINIARRLFHLKGKKVRYWTGMAIETRFMLRKWREANSRQYRV